VNDVDTSVSAFVRLTTPATELAPTPLPASGTWKANPSTRAAVVVPDARNAGLDGELTVACPLPTAHCPPAQVK
jgi:hypothetical protein